VTILTAFKKIFPPVVRIRSTANDSTISKAEKKFIATCLLNRNEALSSFHSSPSGLTQEQARELLEEHGANDVAHKEKDSFFKEILIRCKNPLVIQLFIICIASILMGDPQSAAVVGFMVVRSVGFSYFQEHRSSKAVEKLRAMVQTNCHVLREGEEVEGSSMKVSLKR
jgi:magnesium-transporting ATPase (P-type)